ncbi:MAG: STAS domain-containing protein [Nitrospira sp.]|nr:STAS domain-containing protein [Nitrospira sp.]
MLKITVSNTSRGTTFVLSGRLTGPWVDELLTCWLKQEVDGPAPCHVDLREVTFIDEAGTTLLSQMYRVGVTIQASGCLTRAIVQNLGKTGVHNHG